MASNVNNHKLLPGQDTFYKEKVEDGRQEGSSDEEVEVMERSHNKVKEEVTNDAQIEPDNSNLKTSNNEAVIESIKSQAKKENGTRHKKQ